MHLRRKAREVALQVLYGLDMVRMAAVPVPEAVSLFWDHFTAPEEVLEPFWHYFDDPEAVRQRGLDDFAVPPDTLAFSTRLIEGAWQKRHEIDEVISRHSEHWSISRMSRVDRSILRMAVYELCYCEDIPPKVTLNEAIDLGKTYGSENSGSFINGILDALYGKLQQAGNLPEKSGIKDGKAHE